MVEVTKEPSSIYGRIENIGIEHEGKGFFTVTVHIGSKRLQFDYEYFIKNTRIL